MNKIATQIRQQANVPPKTGHGVLPRNCDIGNHTFAGGECEECKKKQTLQRASLSRGMGAKGDVPPIVNEVLRSPGQPLSGKGV